MLLDNAAIQGSNPFLDYAKFDGKVSMVYRTEQFIDYINIEKKKLFLFRFVLLLEIILSHVLGVGFMVFNAIFNNITVISWWSVLLMEES